MGPAEKGGAKDSVLYAVTTTTDVPAWTDVPRPLEARRRYNEFVELHAALAGESPPPPPLPGKSLFTTEKVLAARRDAFQALLDHVAASPELRCRADVATFLGADSPLRQPGADAAPADAAEEAEDDRPLDASEYV